MACAAAMRSGANGCGCTAAAVERAVAGASTLRLRAFVAIGGRHDQHRPALALGLGDQPLDHEGARAPLRRADPAVVDHQHDRPGARQRLLAVGIEHRLGQRQDDERGRQPCGSG